MAALEAAQSLDAYPNLLEAFARRKDPSRHPLLDFAADKMWTPNFRDGTLGAIELWLRECRHCKGFAEWINDCFAPAKLRNLWPCVSELATAAFLKPNVDELFFVGQTGLQGDKPPDFRIAGLNMSAYIEVNLLLREGVLSVQIQKLISEANKILTDMGVRVRLDENWNDRPRILEREDQFALLCQEVNELSSRLNASKQSRFAGLAVGTYFEGKILTVHVFDPHAGAVEPRLSKPPPSASRRLKRLFQEAVNKKADKKDTKGRRPYVLIFDLTWLPLTRDTDALSMFDQFGNHQFNLPSNVDGVLFIVTELAHHRTGSTGAIVPDLTHSEYARNAIVLLNRLSPPCPPASGLVEP